jgi:hypothetical protein
MKTTNVRCVLVCVGALASFSCGAQDAPQPKNVPPERAAAAREALMSWLECIECSDGELDAVARYAPELERALIQTLRSGLSPATRARIEAKLQQQFRANKWPAAEERQYVDTYLTAADTEYRVRSVKALARIATPGARQALEDAAAGRTIKAADVRQAAQAALESMRPR